MRDNQPVTQNEYYFDNDATLMSTTDTDSHINYANDAFIDVSGFNLDELKGQPHNIVRHPDMPKEAFSDMWSTLKQGEPWSALVKNRRKNGDHYWVRANAMPIIRQGKVRGYMSVRTKPKPQDVSDADVIYRKFQENKQSSFRFYKGVIVRSGVMCWRSMFITMPLRWRLRSAMLTAFLLSALCFLYLSSVPSDTGWLIMVLSAVFLMLSVILELQIVRPIERLCCQALQVASGDVHQLDLPDRVDEVGVTIRAINQLGLMFRWLVNDVSGQAVTVLKASDSLRKGNDDISRHTEQAASNVQQTAATMNAMTTTVKCNSEIAAEVNLLSQDTQKAAENGGKVIEGMIGMMAAISDSSRQIAGITSMINSIAFQTNILALNAAVEAARAGENGRGFAVVAGEVRSLALRSSEASKDIKLLVEESAGHVDSGGILVSDAVRSMEEIVQRVQHVTTLISQISVATSEQASALQEVSLAVDDLDKITHLSAKRVQEGGEASGALYLQATRLAEAISVFR